ncbi:response regulator transcription factor [Dysgonomonas sp. HDW5A]|uniref:response regulator transcription factor n=1 Tax=Dysgonomonas sp. HDW5A TaxID=2714926 RepID=UPI00140E46F3|nr:response regulator transcription factor [Dysgonomonas sp. HDW5A]QIK59738.1 response regulator transcription factor [Dysgonomonas sp. HDW5A]
MKKIKLLLVEDDINLGYIIKGSLEEIIGGYEIILANNGKDGLKAWKEHNPEIIVSDVEMPIMSGLEMVCIIRQSDVETPIVFASARNTSKDVTSGYNSGVNNYIKKPFLPEELDAHIKALMNLRNKTKTKTITKIYNLGLYTFDPEKYSLGYNSQKQLLTSRESGILQMLCENRGELVKRDDILLKFWGTNDYFTSRSLDVFISKMRRYLSKDTSVEIKTIRGLGLILSSTGN